MGHLHLTLFGSFQALFDGRQITAFESMKERGLLTYLAVESDRVHTREAIAEIFWPERPPGVGLANLRHTLAHLRTAIGDQTATPPFLLITPQAIQFNRASDAFIDYHAFVTFLQKHTPPGPAACQEAIVLYRGRLLDGLSLGGCPEFEAWLAVMRERADRLAGQTLACLVQFCVESGDHHQAIHWTQRHLDLEPWNEDIHRQLIWLLAHSGQRAAALHHFNLCTHMLAAELGVTPQPVTLALVERIRSGDQDLGVVQGVNGRPLTGPTLPTGLAGSHHLPAPSTPFVGRTRELTQIAEILAGAECSLLTIVGPGGIGKTRLALELMQALAPRFADGAWFVDLVSTDAATLPTVLLKRLDAPGAGAANARQRLLAYLADKRMMLVLDNFEHLLDAASLVTDILAAAPAVKVSITSRVALRLRQEWLAPLTGLDLPPERAMAGWQQTGPSEGAAHPSAMYADLDAFDATRLFVQCARRLQPDFVPTAEEAALIVQICRHLEGMPLGIELAASWIRSLPLRTLVAEVDSGLQRLETPLRDTPDRHRSMSALFDHSWRLLDEREQTILRALSVFRGGFTQSAAGHVAGADLADLSHLIDASWLRVRTGDRYDMHELVRQYCEARLNDDPLCREHAEVLRRHCTYFGQYLNGQMRRMNYHKEVMTNLMAEFGNLQLAWQWGVEHGEMRIAHDMALGLYFIGDMLGWYHFIIQSYAPMTVTLERIIHDAATPPEQRTGAALVLAWIEYAQGFLNLQLGLVEQAHLAGQRSYAAASLLDEGNRRAELQLLSGWILPQVLLTTGEIEQARCRLEDYRREFEQSSLDFTLYGNERGRKFWTAHAYASLASCAWFQGNYTAAIAGWRQALDLREEMGEQRFCAFNLYNYALACVTLGRYPEAQDLARRGLSYSQTFGDQIGVAFGQMTLGIVSATRGESAVASAYLAQSLATGRQSGNRLLLVRSSVYRGRLALREGEISEAQVHFEEALAAATRHGALPYLFLAEVLTGLGLAALARGEHRPATDYFQQAIQQAPHCPVWSLAEAWLGLARAYLAQGEVAQAHEILWRVVSDPATAAATRQEAQRHLESAGRHTSDPYFSCI